MATYFRWFARGPDLQAIKEKRLQVLASPRIACWIFDIADRWKPSPGVSGSRVLVAIVFDEIGEALINLTVSFASTVRRVAGGSMGSAAGLWRGRR